MNATSPRTSIAAYIQAVRGPVMLTTLGVLLALQQQFEDLRFWKTWPVLIIVFGVMKLLEMSAERRPATPGAGEGIR